MTPAQIKEANVLLSERDSLTRDIDRVRSYTGTVLAYLGKPEQVKDRYYGGYGSGYSYIDYPPHVTLSTEVVLAELQTRLDKINLKLKEMGVSA